jgi:Putative Actinobacterial Holin-X, holin superfamily III
MDKAFAKMEELAITIKEYADCRVEKMKLNVAERTSAIIANLIAGFVVALLFVFFMIFGSVALSFILGVWLGKIWLGFLTVAIFYLILGIIVWKLKARFIQLPIMNFFITLLCRNDES